MLNSSYPKLPSISFFSENGKSNGAATADSIVDISIRSISNPQLYLQPLMIIRSSTPAPSPHIVGEVIVKKNEKPYWWLYDINNHSVTTHDSVGTWDLYHGLYSGSQLFLYDKKSNSSSKNQHFDLRNGKINFAAVAANNIGQHGFVLTHNNENNKVFISDDDAIKNDWEVIVRNDATTNNNDLISTSFTMMTDFDEIVTFRLQGKGGIFKNSVYFSEVVRMSEKQRKCQPTLLFSETDWRLISRSDITHEGAFANDFVLWSREKMILKGMIEKLANTDKNWVLVWKFPGALNALKGFQTIYNIGLPVGNYGFYNDDWWKADIDYIDEEIPINKTSVEKIRVDIVGGGPAIHFLQNDQDIKLAMIGSQFFIREFWKITELEKNKVLIMLNRLKEEIGIYAIPIYGQHHGIVFYYDILSKQRITPEYWVEKIILGNGGKRKKIENILKNAALNDDKKEAIDRWSDNYIVWWRVKQSQKPIMKNKFKLTTYNVLTGPPYPGGKKASAYELELTEKSEEKHVLWENRKTLITNALRDSDLVLLNEVTDDMLKYILLDNKEFAKAEFQKKYESYDGSAILYKKNAFRLLKTFHGRIHEIERQIAVGAVLEHLDSHQKIRVLALHLKSGYDDKENLRWDQFENAMLFLKEKEKDYVTSPVIIAGDFNSDFLREKSYLVKKALENYNLFDAGESKSKDERKITYHHWHKSVFDYILYKDLNLLHFSVPNIEAVIIPNEYYGSDHAPVSAIFEFPPNQQT